MTQEQIEDALHAAIVTASGLPAASVLWLGFEAPQPDMPYVELSIANVQPTGVDWSTSTVEAGPTIVETVEGNRRAALTIAYYAKRGYVFALDQLCSKLRTEEIYSALYAAGVSILSRGAITDLGAYSVPGFEGRGEIVLQLCYHSVTLGETGVIETVQLERA